MNLDAHGFVWRAPSSSEVSKPGALAGLRLSVKDLFNIQGIPTGAGNPDWLASHSIPTHTAESVSRLLDAGAVLVGKTLTDELAYSLQGSNIHYGTLVNPAAPERITGGSSSGAAVSVASNVADIGLGTDTGGSIRVPASYCGLYGFRPSHGAVSLDGCVPLAPRFDTAGWLCRDVHTSLQVGQVLLPQQFLHGFNQLLVIQAEINGQQLWNADCDDWLTNNMNGMQVTRLKLDNEYLHQASEIFRILQGRDIWRSHGEWISQTSPVFAPDIQQRFDWCSQLSQQDEINAEDALQTLMQEFKNYMDTQTLAIFPTTPGAAPPLDASAEYLANYRVQLMGLTALAGLAGYPQLSMPVMRNDDAPWGMSLMAIPGSDRALLQIAAELQGGPV